MAYTLPSEVRSFSGHDFSAAEGLKSAYLIPFAERRAAFAAGGAFHTADRTSDASQDWIMLIGLIVNAWNASLTEAHWTAAASPFASESIGTYRYTLKPGVAASLPDIMTIPGAADILAQYNPAGGPGTLQVGAITYRQAVEV